MTDIAFIVFLLLYLVVGIRVDQWITISLLGFKMATPLQFLKNPRVYDYARIAVFVVATATLLNVSFPWYFGAGALAAAWFITTWIGQRLAFNEYRRICQHLADTAETTDERSSALQSARKTNSELRDMAMMMNKFGG
jgi:hypothetical protein